MYLNKIRKVHPKAKVREQLNAPCTYNKAPVQVSHCQVHANEDEEQQQEQRPNRHAVG